MLISAWNFESTSFMHSMALSISMYRQMIRLRSAPPTAVSTVSTLNCTMRCVPRQMEAMCFYQGVDVTHIIDDCLHAIDRVLPQHHGNMSQGLKILQRAQKRASLCAILLGKSSACFLEVMLCAVLVAGEDLSMPRADDGETGHNSLLVC